MSPMQAPSAQPPVSSSSCTAAGAAPQSRGTTRTSSLPASPYVVTPESPDVPNAGAQCPAARQQQQPYRRRRWRRRAAVVGHDADVFIPGIPNSCGGVWQRRLAAVVTAAVQRALAGAAGRGNRAAGVQSADHKHCASALEAALLLPVLLRCA